MPLVIQKISIEDIDLDAVGTQLLELIEEYGSITQAKASEVVANFVCESVNSVVSLSQETIEYWLKILTDMNIIQCFDNRYSLSQEHLHPLLENYSNERVLVYFDSRNIPLWVCPESLTRTQISVLNDGESKTFAIYHNRKIIQSGRLTSCKNIDKSVPSILMRGTRQLVKGHFHRFYGKNFDKLIAKTLETQESSSEALVEV